MRHALASLIVLNEPEASLDSELLPALYQVART
jgi:predicted ATPase